jgi:hypothetical protein
MEQYRADWAKRRTYAYIMRLKDAALFAFLGMLLLTVLLAAGFIRDVMTLARGAIAAISVLTSGIHLVASLSVTIFLYVFHKAQS